MGKLLDKVRANAPEGATEVRVSYYGSGDSFEEFNSVCVNGPDGFMTSDMEVDDDDLWKILEQSEADFNNDGSRGEVVFDFVNNEIRVENYYIVQTEEPGGGCTFKDED